MIEIKELNAGYRGRPVLEGVNAVFETGGLTSILGVNGCGKSTLLKAILNILPCSAGEILIDGRSVCEMSRNDIAKRIAYLAQGKSTPDMTLEQMVLHGRFPYLDYPRRYTSRDREIAHQAMEKLGIAELASRPLCTLSGGMRQSAYIAMALAQDTDYILLDEPTTYLDISHQLELMRILRELADSGKGIITVMHDLPLAFDFSDKLLLIDGHRAVLEATPTEAAASPLIEEVFGVRIEHTQERRYFYHYS